MNGVVSPVGMPSYTEFVGGVTSALAHVCRNFEGNVLILSSGGPISTAAGQVLGTTPETTIELNPRIRNSSVTEFAFNPKRHMLLIYNTLPHLVAAPYAEGATTITPRFPIKSALLPEPISCATRAPSAAVSAMPL